MLARALPLAVLSIAASFGQSFEAASIREHTGRVPRIGVTPSGNRVSMEAMWLSDLVSYAYGLKDYQVSGGPSWVNKVRWDITAEAEGEAPMKLDQLRKMTQTLLADRFRLQVHRGTEEMPVYALVVGKGGPKMKPSAPDAKDGTTVSGDKTAVLATAKASMGQLAVQLGNNTGRPVLNQTGLSGNYEYRLEWAPRDDTGDAPSIFTAVQEQLGLKLEAQKAPIEVLVIDHAEKPSEN
jgi:uncharacterized protein (TIGR03435 family)